MRAQHSLFSVDENTHTRVDICMYRKSENERIQQARWQTQRQRVIFARLTEDWLHVPARPLVHRWPYGQRRSDRRPVWSDRRFHLSRKESPRNYHSASTKANESAMGLCHSDSSTGRSDRALRRRERDGWRDQSRVYSEWSKRDPHRWRNVWRSDVEDDDDRNLFESREFSLTFSSKEQQTQLEVMQQTNEEHLSRCSIYHQEWSVSVQRTMTKREMPLQVYFSKIREQGFEREVLFLRECHFSFISFLFRSQDHWRATNKWEKDHVDDDAKRLVLSHSTQTHRAKDRNK